MTGVVIVTGGSRGIGRAICLRIAAASRAVVVNYVGDEMSAASVVAEIERAGGSAVAVQGDVSREGDIDRIFAAADALGQLTALVNNAGVVDTAARVEDMGPERLTRMFGVNAVGSILCAGRAVRRMSTRYGGSGGTIVNISSAAAKLGAPGRYADYAASKGAIDTFTVGLAKEVASEGIRVVGVRPGIIDTDIHASGGEPDRVANEAGALPMGCAGTADEVAAAVLWLMSDDAAYSTGAIVDVSGGRSIAP